MVAGPTAMWPTEPLLRTDRVGPSQIASSSGGSPGASTSTLSPRARSAAAKPATWALTPPLMLQE